MLFASCGDRRSTVSKCTLVLIRTPKDLICFDSRRLPIISAERLELMQGWINQYANYALTCGLGSSGGLSNLGPLG
jgi:hypothetical protein